MGIGIGIFVLLILPQFPDKMKHGKNWLFTPPEIELAIQCVSSKFVFQCHGDTDTDQLTKLSIPEGQNLSGDRSLPLLRIQKPGHLDS